MDAKELKSRLSTQDIITIITTLGSELVRESTEELVFTTYACHGGSKPKLCYNIEHQSFMCFTSCGLLDILTIVQNNKDLTLSQSITYICTLLGISDIKYGFNDDRIEVISDWSFINGYKKKYEKLNKTY